MFHVAVDRAELRRGIQTGAPITAYCGARRPALPDPLAHPPCIECLAGLIGERNALRARVAELEAPRQMTCRRHDIEVAL